MSVKVEVAVLGSPSLTVLVVSVDVTSNYAELGIEHTGLLTVELTEM